MSEPLTVEIMREAMDKLWTTAPRYCTHVVHPKYAKYRMARDTDEATVWVNCAACGAAIVLAPALDA